MLDFDLAWPGGGPGDGVSASLPNGVFRQRGPFCACALIVDVVRTIVLWIQARSSNTRVSSFYLAIKLRCGAEFVEQSRRRQLCTVIVYNRLWAASGERRRSCELDVCCFVRRDALVSAVNKLPD